MAGYEAAHRGAELSQKSDRRASRIDQDVETIKTLTNRLYSIEDRIIGHARTLGYFEPAPQQNVAIAPTPVISTLSDAISALDRAIDRCSAALNVFD